MRKKQVKKIGLWLRVIVTIAILFLTSWMTYFFFKNISDIFFAWVMSFVVWAFVFLITIMVIWGLRRKK